MATPTVESVLSELLAYAQQGLVYLEEKNEEGARSMLETASNLAKTLPENIPSENVDLYNDGQNVISSLKQKLEEVGSHKGDVSCDFSETVDAQLLYWLPEGVTLVTIEGEKTNSPSVPTSLAIFTVEEPGKSTSLYPKLETSGHPAAIIQVGPWAYPLIPDRSMVMQNELGVYVVPNPTNDHPDMYVGIILPRDLEQGLENDFVEVLGRYATVRTSDIISRMTNEERKRTSEKIALLLQGVGEKFAGKVQRAASSAGSYVSSKGEKMRSDMKETEKPININPVIKYGVLIGYKGSKAFAKLTRAILDKVGEVGVNIGRRMTSGAAAGDSGASRLISGSANIIGGGIAGVSVAWIALEDASKQLFRSVSDETVEVVRVKYGPDAGNTTYQALHGAGHTTLSAFQLWDLGPRSVAGRMARHAGIQVVKDLGSRKESSANSPGTSEKKKL